MSRAYRSDTFLAWLTDKRYWVKVYPKVGADCGVAAGQIEKGQAASIFENRWGHGKSITDALAEVVMKVMGVKP